MDGVSRSRGWDKEIHHVLPMEQLVFGNKLVRDSFTIVCASVCLSICPELYILDILGRY